jgi:acylphosphatase
MPKIKVRVMIEGRVQGVGYRAWMVEEASRRGLKGWVRNRSGGSVEALIAGATDDVEALIASCRRGPRLARVVGITRSEAHDDDTRPFHALPTM